MGWNRRWSHGNDRRAARCRSGAGGGAAAGIRPAVSQPPHSCGRGQGGKMPRWCRLTKLPASSSFFIIGFESMVYPIKGWPQTMGSVDRMVTHGPKSAKLAGGHDVSAWTNTPTSLGLGAAEAVMSPHPIAHTNTPETAARLFTWGSLPAPWRLPGWAAIVDGPSVPELHNLNTNRLTARDLNRIKCPTTHVVNWCPPRSRRHCGGATSAERRPWCRCRQRVLPKNHSSALASVT